jgi:hypothetical protein
MYLTCHETYTTHFISIEEERSALAWGKCLINGFLQNLGFLIEDE